jgi:hypothetical protein
LVEPRAPTGHTLGVDPYEILQLDQTASREDARAAYRRLAKRFHPDVGGEEATRRMAEINLAYELLRSESAHRRSRARPETRATTHPARPPLGAWLDPGVRRALGVELLGALEDRETVDLVTPTTMWASPRAFLALTDRRLLWLLDDAVASRVRELRFFQVEHAEVRLRWPRRRVAHLRVRARGGRRFVFGDLRPGTAAALAGRLEAARGAA